ncbi:MAG: hypothetical protein AAGG56_03980 [Pseudomonadota bacterium]
MHNLGKAIALGILVVLGIAGAAERSIAHAGERAALAAQLAAGKATPVPAGTALSLDGLRYLADPGSRIIPDLPGWTPVLPASPEHFGAVGDGRDETALLSAVFGTGNVRLPEGKTYGFRKLHVPSGAIVTNAGAVLRYVGGETDEPVLILSEGVTWDRLLYRAAGRATTGAPSILVEARVRLGVLDLEADTQDDASVVQVVGDGVEIGHLRSRRFGRPFSVHNPDRRIDGFRLGWFDLENITRGIRLRMVSNFEIGGGRQAYRSPLTPSERPGRNNILMSGVTNGRFGPMDLADAPEHAVRFGGGGQGGAHRMISENITFAPMTIRRQGASAIKLNPNYQGRVRDVHFGQLTLVDPFQEIGESAKASHLIRVSHADDITFDGGKVLKGEAASSGAEPGVIFAIADSIGVEFGPFEIACCARELAAFVEDLDSVGTEEYGDIRDITFRGISVTQPGALPGAPIRFKTCNIATDEIRFEGLDLPSLHKQNLIKFPECDTEYGALRLEGQVGNVGAGTFRRMPSELDLTVDLTTDGGLRAVGAPDALQRQLAP